MRLAVFIRYHAEDYIISLKIVVIYKKLHHCYLQFLSALWFIYHNYF